METLVKTVVGIMLTESWGQFGLHHISYRTSVNSVYNTNRNKIRFFFNVLCFVQKTTPKVQIGPIIYLTAFWEPLMYIKTNLSC